MYIMINHPTKGWSLGFLYEAPGVPEQFKIFLQNSDGFQVRHLVRWLHGHNIRGVAYCTGGWFDRMRCRRFVKQFNAGMEECGMLADLGEFYEAVMAAEERMKREAAAERDNS